MSYRGFTWNLTVGEADILACLLRAVVAGHANNRVDRKIAETLLAKYDRYSEVSVGGATSSHGSADG